jgi:SAM-dependent methyltransferase
MKLIDECPACRNHPVDRWPALVAPFIAEYALHAPVAACALLECGSCGLRYFNARYEPPEMERLYAGYRGQAYYLARHQHEFWYLRRHNAGVGHEPRVLAGRKAATASFLGKHLDLGSLGQVLDYGGDSGQFIPDGVGGERHVFEVSGAVPVPGVRLIKEEGGLEEAHYDLVLLNHVLEHLVDPVELLRRVARLLKPGTGVLHVEVPFERYDLKRVGRGPGEIDRLARLASSPRLLRWIDFYSTISRVLFDTIPPFGVLKAHEHLNLFHAPSLASACRTAGLKLVAIEERRIAGAPVVAALCRPATPG